MPTPQDQKQFEELLTDNITLDVPSKMLATTLKWVSENMEPEDVFSEKQLANWAGANGFVKGD